MSSYSNAVQQYGNIAADYWAQFDFSPNKRYVKKMCDLFYKDKIPYSEITKVFRDYQEHSELFDAIGINFNQLSFEQLKELVQRQTGEYEDNTKLPNQFYESEDGLITIGYFNTFEEATNFEPHNLWCTSIKQKRFEEYHDINHDMLYIIRNCGLSKRSGCRFVVAQVDTEGNKTYWTQTNSSLPKNSGEGTISKSEFEATLGDAVSLLKPMKIKEDNNYIKTEHNMRKNRTMRLTEGRLRGIISEVVKNTINEVKDTPNGRFIQDSRALLDSLKEASSMVDYYMRKPNMNNIERVDAYHDGRQAMKDLIFSLIDYGKRYLGMDGYNLTLGPD